MLIGLHPTVDYAFKHLFGRDRTRPCLISLSNSVLVPTEYYPGYILSYLDLLNPFNPKEALDDKLSILDIKARDQDGRQFNLEMQMLAFRYYEKRILYYWAKLHQQQLREGQDYLELKPTISISFLDHVLFPDDPRYHWHFRLLDENRRCFTDDIDLHVIELPKFTKTADELETDLDAWLYFLRHAAMMDTDNLPSAIQQRPAILQAVEELTMLTQTDLERERYEARRKAQLDYNTGLKVARMEGLMEGELIGRLEGELKGRMEGELKGRMEGELKGRMEGELKGRMEGELKGEIKRIQLCERLLQRPETPAEKLAGLSLEELERLAQDLENALRTGGPAVRQE